ncbi:Gfo/Idh/MocA family protein [Robertkochia solimangrovi]|uniref:Gfo/Idh/MocA family protein n=1 Tax=Robertkochia solimangrovi TaxID=2213046 RepID=UPI0011816336|nr:Gfo/Idh/MocA family oxidoreductase [Robertkochia solimangrovi]TRZ45706.1 gfo/Idh/MocA family oxidoreductase [Robertkochia solimangrovi]
MKKSSRRSFVKKIGLGLGATTLLPTLSSFEAYTTNLNLPSDKKLNIALCGLGRYASLLAESFKDTKYCHLAGIITGTPSKAVSWQQKYNIPKENIYSYENYDDLVNNKNIDLVYVVLPNGMHKEYTIRAAQAGKHVIVEKPMANTAADCLEMIKACNKAGVQLAVGYRLHYEPNHQELMRLGQQNIFGQVNLIECSLGYDIRDISLSDWHLNKELSGGGALMNLGIYCVQSNRYVLGEEPVSVTAQFAPKTRPDIFKEVEENISWQLNFPSGALCTSNTTSICGVDRFFASADKGYFELSPAVSYGPFRGRSSEKEFDFPVINQQAAQMDGMAKVILAGNDLPDHITGIEGWKDLKVLEAIYQAAETGKRIKIES